MWKCAELRERPSIPAQPNARTRLPSSGPTGPHRGHIRATNDRIAADHAATLTPTMEPERLRNSDGLSIGGVAVAGLEIKNVGEPDETRPFAGKGQAAVVNIAGQPVMYVTYEPGWRWSEHLKPILGTESCEATHLLYCLSGRLRVETNRGEQGEIGPGDVAAIEPGHDAWTVGEEPCVAVDFGSYVQPAKS
jgi:quercetin dioxygenase-like cupin family protein